MGFSTFSEYWQNREACVQEFKPLQLLQVVIKLKTLSKTYNGTAWSEENDMLEGRDYGGNHFGTSTAALFVSGANGSPWPNVMTKRGRMEWNIVDRRN